jgi:hypothetical protein
MPFIESRSEFEHRQAQSGAKYIATGDVLLFSNGAWISSVDREDAPADPKRLAVNVLRFTKECLKQAEQAFKNTQQYITFQSQTHALGSGPPANPNAQKDLERLQQEVFRLRREVERQERELREVFHIGEGREMYVQQANQELQRAERDQRAATAVRI